MWFWRYAQAKQNKTKKQLNPNSEDLFPTLIESDVLGYNSILECPLFSFSNTI